MRAKLKMADMIDTRQSNIFSLKALTWPRNYIALFPFPISISFLLCCSEEQNECNHRPY